MLYQCADSNVKYGEDDFTGYCYGDDQCESYPGSATFYYGLNGCCGEYAFTGYYKLTSGGDCLSCKECIITNLLHATAINFKSLFVVLCLLPPHTHTRASTHTCIHGQKKYKKPGTCQPVCLA